MIGTPSPSTPIAREVTPHGRLRLRLDHGFPSGPLDGAWWPWSIDLLAETDDLLKNYPGLLGHVERVLYSRREWNDQPERLGRLAHPPLLVGMNANDHTHLVALVLRSGQRVHLLVVPPDTDPIRAEALMAAAADDRNERSPTELLAFVAPGPVPT